MFVSVKANTQAQNCSLEMRDKGAWNAKARVDWCYGMGKFKEKGFTANHLYKVWAMQLVIFGAGVQV